MFAQCSVKRDIKWKCKKKKGNTERQLSHFINLPHTTDFNFSPGWTEHGVCIYSPKTHWKPIYPIKITQYKNACEINYKVTSYIICGHIKGSLNCRNVDQSRKAYLPLPPSKITTHTTAPTSHNWLIHKIKTILFQTLFKPPKSCSLCRVWVHVSACSSLGSCWNSETNLFGKLNAVQNRTTHRLCEQHGSDSTAGGRHTHTHTLLAHTHKMAAIRVKKTLTLLSKSSIHWCIELGNNRRARARAITFHKQTAFVRARQIRSEKHSYHV